MSYSQNGKRIKFMAETIESQIENYCKEQAELMRSTLPTDITIGNGYKTGFDCGYNLGSAHAFEDIIRMYFTPPKEK